MPSICNDHNLIDEIIVLAGYSNAYVQFLAGRVLASFLVIAKQEMDDNWLKKLVDNLFNFDRLDHKAVQKIHFSLEIIKRIIEWKDIDLHPLEEEINDTQNLNDGIASTSSTFHGPIMQLQMVKNLIWAIYIFKLSSLL
ncbi:Protein lines [Eumeta japonica]|uniref:Protein lines n=1 Tax=Eumeta variegata TaxID=151549 RepID=A0A4C1TM17_EUMVA|nr:Protein lines [Eumeta japonica]